MVARVGLHSGKRDGRDAGDRRGNAFGGPNLGGSHGARTI